MIIVIASAKGGSGKTTTAMHLAAWLCARRGGTKQMIALHDADPNQSSALWYQRGLEKHPQSFTLIPQDEPFQAANYDHLVIDSEAGSDPEELAGLVEASDLLIVPSRPAMLDMEQTIATVYDLEELREKAIVLLTVCKPRRKNVVLDALTALDNAEISACPACVFERAIVEDTPAFGATLNQVGKKGEQAWQEYATAFKSIFRGYKL